MVKSRAFLKWKIKTFLQARVSFFYLFEEKAYSAERIFFAFDIVVFTFVIFMFNFLQQCIISIYILLAFCGFSYNCLLTWWLSTDWLEVAHYSGLLVSIILLQRIIFTCDCKDVILIACPFQRASILAA